MNPQLAWHIARAAGLVAWALTAAAVIWGLLLSTRIAGRRPPPAWLADLHRYLGGLAVTFTAIHIAALLADTWVQFDVADILVPFASQWRPAALAWGIVAMYLLAAVEVTSLLRRRVPTRWWRAIHLSSFALFVAGTVHLLAAGTDAANTWIMAAVGVAVTAVIYLTGVRLLTRPRRTKRTAHPPTGPHGPTRGVEHTAAPRPGRQPPVRRRCVQRPADPRPDLVHDHRVRHRGYRGDVSSTDAPTGEDHQGPGAAPAATGHSMATAHGRGAH